MNSDILFTYRIIIMLYIFFQISLGSSFNGVITIKTHKKLCICVYFSDITESEKSFVN